VSPKSKTPSKKKANALASDAARRSLGRLERILLLVPFCVRNPGVSISEIAKRFGAPEKEILDDLNLLFVCGLPDYTPADLMEVVIEEDTVVIRMADYFARPLRLTRSEAIPLYLKAQALVNLMSGSGDGRTGVKELASLRSALTKLGKALLPQEGGVAELTKRIKVQLESGEQKWLSLLRDAVTERRRIDLEYYTYSRDNMTRRQVDPHLVFASLGHWYFSGYCHLSKDRRMFRLDRIKSLELTDERFEAPADADAELPPPLIYVPGPDDQLVRIRVAKTIAQWIGDYLPIERSKDLKGGKVEMEFRTSAFPWLEKLLLRFGSDVEVVEPKELAESMTAAAGRILALYKR
jgi:proteasome accessory factor C